MGGDGIRLDGMAVNGTDLLAPVNGRCINEWTTWQDILEVRE